MVQEVSDITEPTELKWEPPVQGFVKLNTDGSFIASDGSSSTGMILRDTTGNIVFTACRHLLTCTDALETELCALSESHYPCNGAIYLFRLKLIVWRPFVW